MEHFDLNMYYSWQNVKDTTEQSKNAMHSPLHDTQAHTDISWFVLFKQAQL